MLLERRATPSPPPAASSAPSSVSFGYVLTNAWTALVVLAIGRDLAGRWFQILGAISAALIFVGVRSPLELPVIDTARFVGYILWSVWLISFGLVILRHVRNGFTAALPAAPTAIRSGVDLQGKVLVHGADRR